MNETKRACNARHLEKLTQLSVKPYKEEAEQIKAAATKAGESTQGYILQAVRQRMSAEAAGGYLLYISKETVKRLAEAHGETTEAYAEAHRMPTEK